MSKNRAILPKSVIGVRVPKTVRRASRGIFTKKFNRGLLAGALIPIAVGLLRRQALPGSMMRNLFKRPRLAVQALRSTGESTVATVGNAASSTLSRAVDGLYNYMHEHEKPRRRQANKAKRRKQKVVEVRSAHH